MNNENIPTEIYPYLKEIADRLWTRHASVMIGAGFSMNAMRVNENCKRFPTWNQLGDFFYEKLHGKYPSDKDKSYLNVLKLADEVEATHGRNVLEKILKDEISDKDFQPSVLHEQLLALPWADVFTTNYDTLLERTAEKILEYRYETVINKQDLVWSTKPRIIKLHGSFPSERPFIITEEDYRTYPKRYAPFVNTVQQSLLENSLCLIGFSGNDPNFLSWIGWIRDNLGKENSPKIFLIGILSLTIGQRKLFEEHNIIPIDLSCFDKVNHYTALTKFISILSKFGKTENNLNWPSSDNKICHIINLEDEDITPQYQRAVKLWGKERDAYPNWLIAPKDSRAKLEMFTECSYSYIYHFDKLDEPLLDIRFLYEFNWRLERYLQPIFNDWINIYDDVLSKYDPIFKELELDNTLSNLTEDTDIQEIKGKWIELRLALLRFYREETFNEKWELLDEKIKKVQSQLSAHNLGRYHYERCLYFVFNLNFDKLGKELDVWKNDFTVPYWEVKRASIIAELGNLTKAESLLDQSLKEIRSRLNLSPTSSDYSLVSQEAYTLQILQNVRRASIFTFMQPKEDKEKYSEKWNQLIQYKCDPWGEQDSYQSFLSSSKENDYKSQEKIYKFGIGQTTTTRKTGGNKFVIKSYQYLRYREEVGLPYKLPSCSYSTEGLTNAISCISTYSPNWGFITFIRVGDVKYIDNIWGRKALALMNWEVIDQLAKNYLHVIAKSTKDNYLEYISINNVIPHILSKLCVKCSSDTKSEIFLFLQEAYTENYYAYKGLDELMTNLMKSLSSKEQTSLMPKIIDFPIIDDQRVVNPISLVDIHERNNDIIKKDIQASSIEKLINDLENTENSQYTKHVLINKLILLWTNDILTDDQVERFGQNLWIETDENGFPRKSGLYYFAFLKLPHPHNIEPEVLFRNYMMTTQIQIQSGKTQVEFGGEGSRVDLLQNAIGSTNSDVKFKWSKKEINSLIAKIANWWSLDKSYLLKTEEHLMGSLANEFKNRFMKMLKAFSSVIRDNYSLVNEKSCIEIKHILQELHEYNLPSLEVKASLLKLFPEYEKEVFDVIGIQLFSKDHQEIFDALNTLSLLSEQKYVNVNTQLANVASFIKCRTEVDLDGFIILILVVLKNQAELITETIISDIEIGLTFLLVESRIHRDDNDEQIYNKLLCRQATSELLVYLKDFLKTNSKQIPEYIDKWQESCLDRNEFAEIRNIWLNKIDIID